MKKKVFYVTMAAIFAATSCTNELPNEQPTDVINIVASISSQTRAPKKPMEKVIPLTSNMVQAS